MTDKATQYVWSSDEIDLHKFAAAKRKVSQLVRPMLPAGVSYKIMTSDYYYQTPARRLAWEIKMDFGKWGSPTGWGVIRWRPCQKGWDSVDMYFIEMANSTSSCAKFDMATAGQTIDFHMPQIKKCVEVIFSGLHPDPLMQLHAAAKKATA